MKNTDSFWLEENFITNFDEIIEIAETEASSFNNRGKDTDHAFISDRYGSSKLFTLQKANMSDKLKESILKTIPSEYMEIPPDKFGINRYDPGSYLVRHRDVVGKYWKFLLVFLRSDKPHLKIYDKKYPDGIMIKEIPGALFHMPLSLEHEVTLIGEDERPRYSLVLAWEI